MRVATVTEWFKSLTVPLLITGIGLVAFVAVFSLSAGAVIFAVISCIVLYSADLAATGVSAAPVVSVVLVN